MWQRFQTIPSEITISTMTTTYELPPFDFHDSGVTSMTLVNGDLTLVFDHVREGEWRSEPLHEMDDIVLIDVLVVFRNISDLKVGGLSSDIIPTEGDTIEVMDLETSGKSVHMALNWYTFVGSPRDQYQVYSFSFDTICWDKLGETKEESDEKPAS